MRAAHIVHHIPGRIRLKLQGAQKDRALLQRLEGVLGEIPYVNRVRVNELTGSIILEYDRSRFSDMIDHASLRTQRAEGVTVTIPKVAELGAVFELAQQELQLLSRHSLAAKHLIDLFHQMNLGVKKASGNIVDLRVLLPLCLSVYSLASKKDRPSPLWLTLLIFAFNSFVTLNQPQKESI